jgi:predicted RNase H-like nuclease (RuvC/YqgF family)
MENIIFYGLVLLCIALLFVIGYNCSKINRLEVKANYWEKSFTERLQEFRQQSIDQTEVYKAAIAERDETIQQLEESNANRKYSIEKFIKVNGALGTTIKNQSNAMQKQVDEITILKEQVESLTNHLKEKAKPFDPLEELDSLTIRPKKATKKK